ncbi:M48 family metallopeptidase [Simiduia curdlanivorans]|uniref:M48 family metallopeptidase n=1 Tax=Simiduia curdlanivorans TaxID=1492769 RepID=A0ABV8V8T2_9GAMM|nr:M48 family metallopeptidase [Simiduia curdlanivorans]MDN3638952.1 M48 family metallopeptidase [Simiduia curdlanivorans]
MNFFEHQDQAKSQTKKLILLLALAVLALIIITTLFVALLLHYSQGAALPSTAQQNFWQNFFSLLDWHLLLSVAFVVLAVVLLGSLYRISQLRQGGAVVAESLNGRLLNTADCDLKEKRLLNIVEEMAIAAGVPVPPVYLLDETGINAFAAGYQPKDAVIGVTRGCLEQLNREQLQGVIAHEYSHILHGDMRLNLRLVGILHGILLIGLIGHMLLRSGRHSRKNGGGIALFGLGLIIIGFAGTFCGNLIKSAVSRQREYLADASAVQFTRNPLGISEALQRIGGYPASSSIEAENASEYSHFYFANGLRNWASGWYSTHPPLDDRIRRIDPRWKGAFLSQKSADLELNSNTQASQNTEQSANFSGFAATASTSTTRSETQQNPAHASTSQGQHLSAQNISAEIGSPSETSIAAAGQLLDSIDANIREACHNPASAMAIIYGLLFTEAAKLEQESYIGIHAPKPIFNLYKHYLGAVAALPIAQRLPVIDLCLPSLKALSEPQLTQFRGVIIGLIKADNHLSLAEWCVFRILQNYLFTRKKSQGKPLDIADCDVEIDQILTLVAQQSSTSSQQKAYNNALTSLNMEARELGAQAAFSTLDKSLSTLNRLKPLQKPRLLKALMLSIQTDGVIDIAEYELLRVIADGLDCPMPLLH